MLKTILFATGAAIVGNMIAEKFVLKAAADDPTGFVNIADGFGLDDVARAATIAATFVLAKKFMGG